MGSGKQEHFIFHLLASFIQINIFFKHIPE